MPLFWLVVLLSMESVQFYLLINFCQQIKNEQEIKNHFNR